MNKANIPSKRHRSEYMRKYRRLKKQEKLNAQHEDETDSSDSQSAVTDFPIDIRSDADEIDSNVNEEDKNVAASAINVPLCDPSPLECSSEEHDSDSTFRDSDSSTDDDDVTFVSEHQQMLTRDFLSRWAIEMDPTVNTINSLLSHLNMFMPSLPKTSTTLKQNRGKIDVKNIGGGQYYYVSVKKAVNRYLDENPNAIDVELIVNIDGLRAYNSRKDSFWPIIATLNNTGPYIICIWYGRGKPSNINLYLEDFVDEMIVLCAEGHRNVSVKVKAFICDAPARSFIKCINNHNSYSGCERCVVTGKYNRGVRLIDTTAKLRNDDNFTRELYDDHQNGRSPLIKINFPMVSGFVLDTMHLVFLGVVKKLITNWCSGKHGNSRWSQNVKDYISSQLEEIAGFIPSCFQRKSRSLDTLDKWKAVEFRLFLLYIGPLVLKGNISCGEYNLFMTLSVAMNILLNENSCTDVKKVMYAKEILHVFVKECTHLYGEDFITYNTHCLIHIADDALYFKCSLNSLSAFKFESYLGRIKKGVRGTKNPVQQMVRRYEETDHSKPISVDRKKKQWKLSIKQDRVFYLGPNKYAIQHRVASNETMLCKIITLGTDWYSVPLQSTDLDYIYKTTITNCGWNILNKDDLCKQAMMLPVKDGGFIFTPLLHTIV